MKKFFCLILSLAMLTTALIGCSSGSASSSANPAASSTSVASAASSSGKKYKVAVSNAYMGNDWRQLMIKCLKVAATKKPYSDEITLNVVNSENTAEAQSSAIDAMVEQGYNAILIDASSSTALLPAIKRAKQAGITVVTFDSVVKADGVYTVQTDFVKLITAEAEYLCKKCKAGSKIAVDTGMPGSTNGNIIYETAMSVFKKNKMNVVAEYASQYADGVCQEQLASVLAAHHDLDAIFCQAYAESCHSALTQAGMKSIPCAAFDTNLGMKTALQNNMDVIIGNNCPGVGVIALDVAVRALKGEKVEQDTYITPGMFVNQKDANIDVGMPTTVIKDGTNCWSDAPNGLDWPALPVDFKTITLTESELANYAS